MIRVIVWLGEDDEQQLAELHITRQRDLEDGMSEYHAEIAVDDGESHRLMTVMVDHAREQGNVLALIYKTLSELSIDQLSLKGPISSEQADPSDVAWGLDRALQALQARASGLRDYRSALRSRQLEQSSDDS